MAAKQIDEITAEIIIFGVEKSDKRRVDRQLLRQLDSACDENLENLLLVVGQIRF